MSLLFSFQGNIKVGDLWRKSLLEWGEFISLTEVDNFVKKHVSIFEYNSFITVNDI